MKLSSALVLCVAIIGCGSSSVGKDGDAVMVVEYVADGGTSDGGNALPLLFGDGASCDTNDQCENDYCLPSINSFGAGVCFSSNADGCIVVTDPSPMKKLCAPKHKVLYACGESYDVSGFGVCEDVGFGEFGERYNCCDKPGFP